MRVRPSTAAVRPSTDADRPEIAALLDRLLREIPYDRRVRLWDWRARDNPAADGGMPEFLVVEKDGRLAGAHGLFPLRVKAGERVVTAATSCDFAVAPAARSLGLPLKLRAMSPEIAELPFSTSANEAAQRITDALGGVEVPWGRTKYLKPLRASGLLRRRLRSRMGDGAGPIPDLVARVGGTPVDAALRWGRAARRRLTSEEVRVERVERFEGEAFRDRFDGLWSRVAPGWTVAVVRDARYLRWRYGRYPFPGVEAVAARDGSDTTGFAAFHHHLDRSGLRFTALLDLFGTDLPALEALLAEVLRRADAREAHYVTAKAGAGELRDALERNGFLAREAEYCPYNVRGNAPDLEPLLSDPGNWHVSQGDGDACFFVSA